MPQVKINLAKLLNVSPKKAFSYLTVSLGKKIEEGRVIAFKKGLLGKKEVKMPCQGKLIKYEEDSGILVLEKEELPLFSGVAGEKAEKKKTTGVKGGKIIEGEFGFGTAEGEIFHETDFALPDLSKVLEEKILVVNKEVKPVLLYRAAALGIKGIVCGLLAEGRKKELLNKQKSFQGFALLSLDFEKNKDKLTKLHQGERVLLEGRERALYRIPEA